MKRDYKIGRAYQVERSNSKRVKGFEPSTFGLGMNLGPLLQLL